MTDQQFSAQLKGYSLTTAEILYHLPDYHTLLQSYIWQDYDIAPQFPKLKKFLDFWSENLEGPLHTIRVAHTELIKPAEFSYIDGEFRVH